MKLLTRYSRINLLAMLLVFLAASAAYYILLRQILVHQVDEDLEIEQREITTFVARYKKFPENVLTVDDQIVKYVPVLTPKKRELFSTLKLQDREDEGLVNFRQLRFAIRVNEGWYYAYVSKSMEATDKLSGTILFVTLGTILLLFAVSYFTNQIILYRLWKPFYRSLERIKQFKIGRGRSLSLEETNIEEFSLMNDILMQTTAKAENDYLMLKEFTENAAHELQTPLAIIRSQLDLLIQSDLSAGQTNTIQAAYNAVKRLSNLNHSLLLLTKIENRQYEEKAAINLTEKIREKLAELEPFLQARNINVTAKLIDRQILINPILADVLLNNLFSNAIHHNTPNGEIWIALNENSLLIRNTSNEETLDEAKLFRRFYRSKKSKESNGLGLSIIKQICDVSGFKIMYKFYSSSHEFIIEFDK